MNRYASFFAALRRAEQRGCRIDKEELVYEVSAGKSTSIKDFTDGQIVEIVNRLNRFAGNEPKKWQPANETEATKDVMRKKIISQFRFIGCTSAQAMAWAEKWGVKGNKRKFNDYTIEELSILIEMAKKVKRDFIKRF